VDEVLQVQPELYRWEAKGVKAYVICFEQDAVLRFMSRYNMQIPALIDASGTVADAYGVSAIPQSVWIDKQGKIKKVTVGWRQQHLSEFDKLADSLSR
jgi:peroxiredoxin